MRDENHELYKTNILASQGVYDNNSTSFCDRYKKRIFHILDPSALICVSSF